jgi:flagellar biosynthesis protein FlhF
MELKRILARDSRSANEKAIQLYGKEVMIISSQKVDNQIELVVAIESPEQASGEIKEASVLGVPTPQAHSESNKSFGKFFQEAHFEPLPEVPQVLATPALSESVQSSGYELKRGQEIVSLLREEIANLREDLLLTMRSRMMVAGPTVSEVAQQLLHQLAEAGMPASMRLLLESGLEKTLTLADGLAFVNKTLLKSMRRAKVQTPSAGRHAVVGPSGVGKTSMLARLAQAAAAAHGVEAQAMISFADNRPGAWSQLQVLASQAGVACYRAHNLQSLKAVLEDLGPHLSVWVDTAGMQFQDTADELQALGLQVHAVLPVDATMTHVQKMLTKRERPWASLMLSKVDEAMPSWAVIKGLCETPLPVSCMSNQVGIQSGLLTYDAQLLIDRALTGVGQTVDVALPLATKAKAVRRSITSTKTPAVKRTRQVLTKAVHG